MLEDNIRRVRDNIARSAQRAGRSAEDVTLVAVSKTVDAHTARRAWELGLTHMGENRVQSLLDKYGALGDAVDWHLIGHLQTNKVKYIIDKVSLVHSVDSLHLAREIGRRASEAGRIMDILIEVNAAGEESKYGVPLSGAEQLALEAAHIPGVRVCGLMTIAPICTDPEDNRKYFYALHKKFVDIREKKYDNIHMGVLSMGMTGDYTVAIEEGATMVRVGRGIFADA